MFLDVKNWGIEFSFILECSLGLLLFSQIIPLCTGLKSLNFFCLLTLNCSKLRNRCPQQKAGE
jgi:hypothetical protein